MGFSEKYRILISILGGILPILIIIWTVFNLQDKSGGESLDIDCNRDSPCIAFVIDDFGYAYDHIVDGFLSIDEKLTFAVIPGHSYSKQIAREASENGFEILVHMPMESHEDTLETESYFISSVMTAFEIENETLSAFHDIPEAVGMNNHQGSKATEMEWAMKSVGLILKREGKYFLDSRTSSSTVAETTIREQGVKTAHRDVFIDNELSEQYMLEKISEMEKIAKRTGFAIGIGHVREMTLTVLKKIIPKIKENGIQLCFVSELLK